MAIEYIEGVDEDGNAIVFPADMLLDFAIGEPENKKEKKELPKIEHNEWIYTQGQYIPARDTTIFRNMEPGFYSVLYDKGQYAALKEEINTDKIYKLPNTIVQDVVNEIGLFWDKKDLFAENDIIHKRGVLLFGKPGCGKTSIINHICDDVIEKGGVIFHVKSIQDLEVYLNFIHLYLRKIEPNTPVATVIEDIDKLLYQNESALLAFLDGEDQFEHNVIIATTNRIQDLNDLLLRPSRFDWLIEIKPPKSDVRRFFLEKKGLTDKEEIEKWVAATKGLSMAHLKELFIAVKLLDNDFDAVIDRLNSQDKQIINTTFKPKMESTGFKFGN